DFANVVLIMTSNLGSSMLTDIVEPAEVVRERVLAAVGGAFKPEFLARRAAPRPPPGPPPAARAWVAAGGYDPAYGARPLRRLVAKAIGDELARRLLAGELGEGDTVVVDAEGDKLGFPRRQPAGVP